MAAQSFRAGAPKDAGSSPSATNGLFVTESSKAKVPERSGESFSKAVRLLKTPDFQRVYDHGKKVSGPFFLAICALRSESVLPRIGFTVPRRLGNSVIRNRIRRRMREAVRLEYAALAAGRDLVIHPRQSVLEAPFLDLRREVERVFARCGTFS